MTKYKFTCMHNIICKDCYPNHSKSVNNNCPLCRATVNVHNSNLSVVERIINRFSESNKEYCAINFH